MQVNYAKNKPRVGATYHVARRCDGAVSGDQIGRPYGIRLFCSFLYFIKLFARLTCIYFCVSVVKFWFNSDDFVAR